MDYKKKKDPNVILMFVDDLGYGDISAFNENGKICTPNIDRLAHDGMMFTDSHACSALCTPSRYGLLTGRYDWRSRLKFLVLPGDSGPLVEKERMTMADMFKQKGYHTACVGKWHLGLEWHMKENPGPEDFGEDAGIYQELKLRKNCPPVTNLKAHNKVQGLDIDYSRPIKWGPNQYGFDYFFGMPASLDQPPYVYIENDRVLEEPTCMTGDLDFQRCAQMQTKWERGPKAPSFDHEKVLDDMNDKVIDLIDQYSRTDAPFFIYYPTPAVHGPLLPKKEFKGKSGLNVYADLVLQVDDMVRQITEKLEEKGILEDTVIIFTSDNGCSDVADYPCLLSKGHNPSYIFRGHKSSIYEGGHRVPTIVHYPSGIKGGQVCQANVSHTDFFKTFADLIDVKVPDQAAEDSVSNLPLWKSESREVRQGSIYSCASGYLGIVKGFWKLECCENGGNTSQAMRSAFTMVPIEQNFELYNLNSDISEQENLIDKYPEIVKELKVELTRCVTEGRSTPGEKQKNFIPEYPWVQLNWETNLL